MSIYAEVVVIVTSAAPAPEAPAVFLIVWTLLGLISAVVGVRTLHGPLQDHLSPMEDFLLLGATIGCGIVPGAALVYALVLRRRYARRNRTALARRAAYTAAW